MNVQYVGKRFGKLVDCVNSEVCSKCPIDLWKSDFHLEDRGCKDNGVNGCCRDCGRYSGYFTSKSCFFKKGEYSRAVGHLKRLYGYTKEYGFFDFEKKVCKLPRHRRSETCLSHHCEPIAKALRKKHGKLIMELLYSYVDYIIGMRKGKIWQVLR